MELLSLSFKNIVFYLKAYFLLSIIEYRSVEEFLCYFVVNKIMLGLGVYWCKKSAFDEFLAHL